MDSAIALDRTGSAAAERVDSSSSSVLVAKVSFPVTVTVGPRSLSWYKGCRIFVLLCWRIVAA